MRFAGVEGVCALGGGDVGVPGAGNFRVRGHGPDVGSCREVGSKHAPVGWWSSSGAGGGGGGLLCYLVLPVQWCTDELRAPDFLDGPTFPEDTAPSCMGRWWACVLLLPLPAATEGVIVPIYTGGNGGLGR